MYIMVNTPLHLAPSPVESEAEEEQRQRAGSVASSSPASPPSRKGNAQPAGLSRRTRKELISMALASGYQESDLDGLTVPQLRLLLVGWDPASVPRSQPSASSAAASAAQGAERPTGADRATPPECTCNRRAMVLKKNASKFGDEAWFWSCQEWPRCRQTYQYQVPPAVQVPAAATSSAASATSQGSWTCT
jgi:hypothetical protein